MTSVLVSVIVPLSSPGRSLLHGHPERSEGSRPYNDDLHHDCQDVTLIMANRDRATKLHSDSHGTISMTYQRVAALYDIHGNLPALDAVLDDVRAASVDLIVVGGDVVPGPMPAECMARLLELDLPARFI